jgi:SAM-dependent methyltransferase
VNHESAVNEPNGNTNKGCLPDEVIDVKTLDWNRLWQDRLAMRPFQRRDACYWDERAPSFAKSRDKAYTDCFLDIMKPEADWTVLDMGCGSGALAVPLAKRVSSVTAVDFSREMLAVVRKRCEDETIRNIETIHGRWEDDWEKLGIGTYDAAIASRSMIVNDLQAAVLKLNAAAGKRVYIVTLTGDGPHDRRIFDAIGRPFDPGPDYIYYYNLLYQLGITANLAFIEETRNRTYAIPEEAVESVEWMFNDLTSREKLRLADYFKEHLVFQSGAWKLSYSTIIRWAVMWWEK